MAAPVAAFVARPGKSHPSPDDTPVQVQDPEKKRRARKAYLWPYLGDDTLLALRHEQARPLLDEFHAWLIDAKQSVLLKSPIGQAMDYALNHWTALTR